MLCTNAARDNIGSEPLVANFKASRTVCSCVQPRTELLRNLVNHGASHTRPEASAVLATRPSIHQTAIFAQLC